jgi:hypothetical protein
MYLYDLDRRHADRYKVPNAKIKYRLSSGTSDITPMKDMAQNSASFQVNHEIKPGDIIELDILIPAREKITVKATCVRITAQENSNLYFAAVQFLPFSTIERYNSFKSQEQLRVLFEEFKKTLLTLP